MYIINVLSSLWEENAISKVDSENGHWVCCHLWATYKEIFFKDANYSEWGEGEVRTLIFLALRIQRITLHQRHCFLFCWLLLKWVPAVMYDSSCAQISILWYENIWTNIERPDFLSLSFFKKCQNLFSEALFIFRSL